MRRLNAFLLTALVCINLFGFYGIFLVRQAEIKGEMSEQISSSSSLNHSEVITLSKTEFAELAFTDNGKEFRMNGRLYDVVRVENNGSTVTITAEFDSKETALVDAFGGILSQQQDKDQSSSPLKTIISHFQQDYIASPYALRTFYNTTFTGYYVIGNRQLVSAFEANNFTPPPQFFLV